MENSSAPGQYKSAYKKYNKWSNWNKNKDSNNQNKDSSENNESNQKPSNNYSNNNNNNASNLPESSFDLGKNKRVTVRQFRNVNLIDIREYYKDSNGDLKPGKKGISLTEDMFDSLLSNYKNIDEALRRLGSDRNNSVDLNAFENLKNNDAKQSQSSTAGTLLIDNSGTVKSEEDSGVGTKRSNEEPIEKDNSKKLKESGSLTPAPPQEEQHKKVEALENSANLVIPTKQVKKDVDSDDDFANDLENELAN